MAKVKKEEQIVLCFKPRFFKIASAYVVSWQRL